MTNFAKVERRAADRRQEDQILADRILFLENEFAMFNEQMQQHMTVTNEIREIVGNAKGFFKVVGLLGTAIKWAAGVGTAVGALYIALKTGAKQ